MFSTAPQMRIHVDFAGFCMGKMLSIIYNSYLKWIDAIPMTNITSSSVIDCLRYTFSIHGIPYFIINDDGPSFASQYLNNFSELVLIKHLIIAWYHPSSNSATERLFETFKTSLKKIEKGKKS